MLLIVNNLRFCREVSRLFDAGINVNTHKNFHFLDDTRARLATHRSADFLSLIFCNSSVTIAQLSRSEVCPCVLAAWTRQAFAAVCFLRLGDNPRASSFAVSDRTRMRMSPFTRILSHTTQPLCSKIYPGTI